MKAQKAGGLNVATIAVALCAAGFLSWAFWPRAGLAPGAGPAGAGGFLAEVANSVAVTKEHVLLELFVMSKCPDAKFCEESFQPVLERLHPIVKVKTEYLGSLGDKESVACMHGPMECEGNKHQLCLQHHIPRVKNYEWFYKYLLCTWKAMEDIGKLSAAQACMEDVGMHTNDLAPVLECINSSEADSRLFHSVKTTRSLEIQRSCTVRINGKHRCVRDGGSWYDCPGGSEPKDFENTICDVYKEKTGVALTGCGTATTAPGNSTEPTTAAATPQAEPSASDATVNTTALSDAAGNTTARRFMR